VVVSATASGRQWPRSLAPVPPEPAVTTPQMGGSVSTNFWMPVPGTTGPVQVAPVGTV
jgi:hypothetical protein